MQCPLLSLCPTAVMQVSCASSALAHSCLLRDQGDTCASLQSPEVTTLPTQVTQYTGPELCAESRTSL